MIFLRSLLFNIWFYGVTFSLAVAGSLASLVSRAPAPQWPLAMARLWASLSLTGLRVICGTSWVVTGREHLPAEGPALIASMHQSAFDTMVWMLLVPKPCYVLKKELGKIPLFGTMCRLTGMIQVDREAGASAIRGLMHETDRAVREVRQIVIFPEGTRAAPGQPKSVQPGVAAMASRAKLPVIPVATDSGICWGRRAFRKRPGVIHIAIGAPVPAELRRDALISALERRFADGAAALGTASAATCG